MPPTQGVIFLPPVSYSVVGFSAEAKGSVQLADVNHDGILDMLVSNFCEDINDCDEGSIAVLLGNGDGTFQTATTYAAGGVQTTSLAVADLNGDGNVDVVATNYLCLTGGCSFATIGVLMGNGDGTFQAVVNYPTGGYGANGVAIADLNGDGAVDVAVVNYCDSTTHCIDGSVTVLLGNGDGTLQPAAAGYDSGGSHGTSIATGDVNGDGKPDLIVVNSAMSGNADSTGGTVGVLLGNGDGTFESVVTYGSGGVDATAVVLADINGDGKQDIVASNQCVDNNCDTGAVGVLLGNGDGSFQTAVSYGTVGVDTFSVAVADVNGDRLPDVLVANDCFSTNECNLGGISVLLGNGDGTLQNAQTYSSGGYVSYAISAGDVNGDGKPDVLVANTCSNQSCQQGSTVTVLVNATPGLTSTQLTSSLNPSPFGQNVTFTATVTSQGFLREPTGTVSFFDGTTNIGNAFLNSSGVGTLTTAALTVGTHSMTATYNGDANYESSTSPVLYQVVQGAIATLAPTGLNFGNQTVGMPSATQKLTLTNVGNIDLNISSIGISGVNGGDFSQKNNCPEALHPNTSCNIGVNFTPTTTGTRAAALMVADNAPDSPQSATLAGVGVLPAVMLSPGSLTFATQVVFTTSPPQKLTLTNTGLGVLEIKAAKISGPFGVTTDCGKTLAAGASCTAKVVFKPTTEGPETGAITLTDNAPDSPQQVPLSGTGTFVQLIPTSVTFGNQPVNTTSAPKYIVLTNKGSSIVNFTGGGITITGTDAGDFAENNNCGSSVASGASCKIKVTFTPSQQGKRTADVSISDDGGGSPQLVPLTGTGTP